MTVYRQKRGLSYSYDFMFRGKRYRGTTGQLTLTDARRAEDAIKQRVRRAWAGIPREQDAPRFSEWAEVYYTHAAARLARPDHVEDVLRVVLRFWGARPRDPVAVLSERDPYHDLTLADPIVDPDWIERFEAWMGHRPRCSPQTRNHYRSVMSRMYRVAMLPKYRKVTGITMNPFLAIERDHTVSRDVTVTPAQLRAWISEAPYHIRLAVAIGALAPTLRLRNILELRFDEHLDPGLEFITIPGHKTVRKIRRPLVQPISAQLRAIIEDRQQRGSGSPYVVTYRGQPVRDIRYGVRRAAEKAGLVYGLTRNGVTFHSLRHIAQTEMADLEISESKRSALMGHTDAATTRKYTHLRPRHLIDAVERLSARLPLADIVMAPVKASPPASVKNMGSAQSARRKTTANTGVN